MSKKTIITNEVADVLCQKHLSGSNVTKLHNEFGIRRSAIERLLKERGIFRLRHEINRELNPTLKDHDLLYKMYVTESKTIDQIALEIGVSSQLIKNAFRELGIVARSRSEATIVTGIKNNPALNDSTHILDLYNSGISVNALSEQLSVSETAIKRILKTNGARIRNHPEQMTLSVKPANEVNARIASNLRSRLSIALKNTQKKGSAVRDLGCSVDEFKKYLESSFYESDDGIPMSWGNYGRNGWELDHIVPLSSFDLSDQEQLIKACHYTNLAPAWRNHNRAKSDSPLGRKPRRIPLIILTGQSGVGKSWITNQLSGVCQILEYDKVPKEQHYHYLVEMSHRSKMPIIYDPLRKPMSMYRRYRHLFDTQLLVINEEPDVVKSRILGRGGKSIHNVDHFYDKFKRLATKAHLSGKSNLVLDYIIKNYGLEIPNYQLLNQNVSVHSCSKNELLEAPTALPAPAEKPIVYLVSGVSGSGKSWVCEQLLNKFTYVSYDREQRRDHLDLLKADTGSPKLYDPSIKISTFIRRYSHLFDIRPVFIIEDESVIRDRLEARGGVFTDYAPRRIKVIASRAAKYGVFSGTSAEVLGYLDNVVV